MELHHLPSTATQRQFINVIWRRFLSDKEAQLDIEFKLKMRGFFWLMELFIGRGFRKEVRDLGTRIKGMMEK